MQRENAFDVEPPRSLRMRFLAWRNKVLGDRRFQRFAAANPVLRPIAKRRAGALFDLVAGFVYTQVLLAVVESGLLARLAQGPGNIRDVMKLTGFGEEAVLRLLRAAAAIDILEEGEPGWWVLGRHGAALQSNEGAIAMIRHHRLLYSDLADPLEILADETRSDTRLAQFWKYTGAFPDDGASEAVASEYSHLMAQSQIAVAQEVLAAFSFKKAKSLLDIGGGSGTFLKQVAAAHPGLRLGLFDLPKVTPLAAETFEGLTSPQFHPGNFFGDSIPGGYDLVSLIRVLHDHDDDQALKLLQNIHRAMVPGTRLILAEPMADTPGAKGMGDAYFGLYLWAMGSGRPRSVNENRAMLKQAGFSASRDIRTNQPLVTSLIVARA